MYIILNKKPVDVFKIERVSSVIALTNRRYRAAKSRLVESTFGNFKSLKVKSDHKLEKNIIERIIKHTLDYHRIDPDLEDNDMNLPDNFYGYENETIDTIYGYYFVLNVENESYICSKVYATEELAYKNLKDLLELINTTRNIVPEITI